MNLPVRSSGLWRGCEAPPTPSGLPSPKLNGNGSGPERQFSNVIERAVWHTTSAPGSRHRRHPHLHFRRRGPVPPFSSIAGISRLDLLNYTHGKRRPPGKPGTGETGRRRRRSRRENKIRPPLPGVLSPSGERDHRPGGYPRTDHGLFPGATRTTPSMWGGGVGRRAINEGLAH